MPPEEVAIHGIVNKALKWNGVNTRALISTS